MEVVEGAVELRCQSCGHAQVNKWAGSGNASVAEHLGVVPLIPCKSCGMFGVMEVNTRDEEATGHG